MKVLIALIIFAAALGVMVWYGHSVVHWNDRNLRLFRKKIIDIYEYNSRHAQPIIGWLLIFGIAGILITIGIKILLS